MIKECSGNTFIQKGESITVSIKDWYHSFFIHKSEGVKASALLITLKQLWIKDINKDLSSAGPHLKMG